MKEHYPAFKAMKETVVKTIVAFSSIGIYETPLRSVLLSYRKLADVIESSGLISWLQRDLFILLKSLP